MNTRGIHEDHLSFGLVPDAHDPVARGLGFARCDRDFFADEGIEQRRFPDVWPPDDADKSGFKQG